MSLSLIYYSQEAELFEGPIFDTNNNLLYFVSILDSLIYCYSPNTKEILSIKLDSPTSNVYLTDDIKIVVVASKDGFYKVNFRTLSTEFKFQIDVPEDVRYNDGIQDLNGRYLIGTMGYPKVKDNVGKVYSIHNNISKVVIENTTISNGLAFSLDNKYLYFIDTPTKKIAKYNYNIETGDVEFVDNVVEFNGAGSPDGMCIDNNGMLWVAEWGGSCVSNWNPNTGEKIREIKLPYTNVTSCCFDNDKNLYVTTAKDELSPKPTGSGLFYIELNKNQTDETY